MKGGKYWQIGDQLHCQHGPLIQGATCLNCEQTPTTPQDRKRQAMMMPKCKCGNVARWGQEKCGRCINTEAEFEAARAATDLEKDDAEYLRDLAERIFRIPVMYDVDCGDYDRLRKIARGLEHLEEEEI